MKIKIDLKEGQQVWITSDTHYGHKNIVRGISEWDPKRGGTRDFDTLEEMNDLLVNNINEVVGQEDILIHLGDWSFGGAPNIKKFRDRIICQNIYLIYGNHDENIEVNNFNVQSHFVECNHISEFEIAWPQKRKDIKIEKFNFIACHYPIASWESMGRGKVHLFGHIHTSPPFMNHRSMDVGVDGNMYYPWNILDIKKIMDNQETGSILCKDHHVK